jgi:hypothetical protein
MDQVIMLLYVGKDDNNDMFVKLMVVQIWGSLVITKEI